LALKAGLRRVVRRAWSVQCDGASDRLYPRFSNFGHVIAFNPLGAEPPEEVRAAGEEMAAERGFSRFFRSTEPLADHVERRRVPLSI
jgi:hypothetical protein